jgi:hypothetical protein
MISEQPVRHYLSQITIITYIIYNDDDDDDNNNRILHNAHKLTNGALRATTVMFYAIVYDIITLTAAGMSVITSRFMITVRTSPINSSRKLSDDHP